MTSHPPQILIFGAGAVGAFYGALLARSAPSSSSSSSSRPSSPPPEVSVICRSNYAHVASNGFALSSPTFGRWHWRPTHVYPSPDAAARARKTWDYVVVATKALPDIGDDSAALSGLVAAGTTLVLVQNGLGVERSYAARFPATPLLSAVTVVSAAQPSHGRIKHNRWTRISVGPYGGNTDVAARRAVEFCELLRDGGVRDAEAYSAEKLQLLRWHKVAINAAMNPSSVLSGGAGNAGMANDEELARHLKGVMEEVLSAAETVCGAQMPREFASPEAILASTRRNDSGSRPSMWADWSGGRPLELEAILGEPIRAAREKGVAMPRLETMYALLKMAQRNRDELAAAKRKGKSKL